MSNVRVGVLEKGWGILGMPVNSFPLEMTSDQYGLRLKPDVIEPLSGKSGATVGTEGELAPGQRALLYMPHVQPIRYTFSISLNPALGELGIMTGPTMLGFKDLPEGSWVFKADKRVVLAELPWVWELRAWD